MNGTRPYGVLGEKLGHSYTPVIYRELAGLDYVKFEREPDQLEAFLRGQEWEGVNVTIPYKKAVLPYLDELSDIARRMGNVNTVTRMADGRLRGDNTDYFGFRFLLESTGIDYDGALVLVLGGNGGAGSTALKVLADLGAQAISVNRSGDVTYADLERYAHADAIVNCTPVGMFPACPATPCRLDPFDNLKAVVDIVYNPARTQLMMDAERRGIPAAGGLLMLVAQAAQAVERYTGRQLSADRINEVCRDLLATEQNVALIGMPGCGKTRVGQQLAGMLGRTHVDIDHELEKRLGCTCAAYIEREGEQAFRELETACLRDIAPRSHLVVSCGGGVVTRKENYALLHQNSRIVMLNRPLNQLSRENRPITARDGVERLAAERMHLYRSWADDIVDSRESAEATARVVRDSLPSMLDMPAADA